MALRAFRANPCLGGFGGESSGRMKVNSHATEKDCDAFAQIVKELVDNAVDACHHSQGKRIRVVIERLEQEDDDDGEYAEVDYRLRVTVSDNGCGMADIQQCVNAFRSSKAGNTPVEEDTAGRYGIGLTLCLLHAQRLVPDSCASITSATSDTLHFTRASYVVDTEGDSVRCVKRELLPKTNSTESGTAVSLLVPGGDTAHQAWPRLAEYFARFQLSIGMQCGLEVLAPSLSSVPLFIRPASKRLEHQCQARMRSSSAGNIDDDEELWSDGMSDMSHVNVPPSSPNQEVPGTSQVSTSNTDRRLQILAAANTYLKRPVEIENVAHSIQPIGRSKRQNQDAQPTLEVNMIVYGPDDDDEDEDDSPQSQIEDTLGELPSASLMLVRMVNGVPLLDGAEASACGLVQGIAQKQSTWNSFGLCVMPTTSLGVAFAKDQDDSDDESSPVVPGENFVPTYAVRDSDQVAPFIRSGTHDLYDIDEWDAESQDDDASSSEEEREGRSTRRKRSARNQFLPAHLRLGNVLLIVQINAKPSSLPLPTLSKGRLPMNNHSIESALELGIMTCLKSFQVTNPSLLLTANQLKETIRDTRYVPAVAASMAFIVSKSNNPALRATVLQAVQHWSIQDNDQTDQDQIQSMIPDSMSQSLNNSADALDDEPLHMPTLGQAIEERFRFVISASTKPAQRSKKSRAVNRRHSGREDRADEVDLDEFLQSEPESHHESQMSEVVEDPRQELLEQISLSSSRLSLASFASSSDEPMGNASSFEAWGKTLSNPGRPIELDEDNCDDDEWW